MNCEECKENKFEEPVPFRVHERMMARAERTQKRLWITIILLIALLVGSNMAWMYYENSFEDIVTTQEVSQEAESGTNNFVGGDMNGQTDD